MERDYFAILEISAGASEEEIRAAYRRLARRYHPDLHPERADAEERQRELNEAYAVLSDPAQRARYLRARRIPIRVESSPGAAPPTPPYSGPPATPPPAAPRRPDVGYGSHVDLSDGRRWPRAYSGLGGDFRAPYGSPVPPGTLDDAELALLYARRLLRALFGW